MVLAMVIRRLGLLLVPLLLLSACSGTTQDVPAADKQVQAYFDDIATQTVDSLRSAIHLAAPGSPAATYATYLEASTQAAQDGGQAIDPTRRTAERTESGYRFCQGSASKRVCFDYTGISRSRGLVSDFAINGKPVSGRLALGDDSRRPFADLSATAGLVAALEATANGKLLVVVSITASGAEALEDVQGTYQPPQGGQVASSMTLGRPRLEPGSTANYLFAFSGARIGGTVTVSASGQGHRGSATVQVGQASGS
jgi:hypothetical protein